MFAKASFVALGVLLVALAAAEDACRRTQEGEHCGAVIGSSVLQKRVKAKPVDGEFGNDYAAVEEENPKNNEIQTLGYLDSVGCNSSKEQDKTVKGGVLLFVPGVKSVEDADRVQKHIIGHMLNIAALRNNFTWECIIFVAVNASKLPLAETSFAPCKIVRHFGQIKDHWKAVPTRASSMPYVVQWQHTMNVKRDVDFLKMICIMEKSKLQMITPAFNKSIHPMMRRQKLPTSKVGRLVNWAEYTVSAFTRDSFICLQEEVLLSPVYRPGRGADAAHPRICHARVGILDTMTVFKEEPKGQQQQLQLLQQQEPEQQPQRQEWEPQQQLREAINDYKLANEAESDDASVADARDHSRGREDGSSELDSDSDDDDDDLKKDPLYKEMENIGHLSSMGCDSLDEQKRASKNELLVFIPGVGSQESADAVELNIVQYMNNLVASHNISWECFMYVYVSETELSLDASSFAPCKIIRHHGQWMDHWRAVPARKSSMPYVVQWLDSMSVRPNVNIPKMLCIMEKNRLQMITPAFDGSYHKNMARHPVVEPDVGRLTSWAEFQVSLFTRDSFICLQDKVLSLPSIHLGYGVDIAYPVLCNARVGVLDTMSLTKWRTEGVYDKKKAVDEMHQTLHALLPSPPGGELMEGSAGSAAIDAGSAPYDVSYDVANDVGSAADEVDSAANDVVSPANDSEQIADAASNPEAATTDTSQADSRKSGDSGNGNEPQENRWIDDQSDADDEPSSGGSPDNAEKSGGAVSEQEQIANTASDPEDSEAGADDANTDSDASDADDEPSSGHSPDNAEKSDGAVSEPEQIANTARDPGDSKDGADDSNTDSDASDADDEPSTGDSPDNAEKSDGAVSEPEQIANTARDPEDLEDGADDANTDSDASDDVDAHTD